MLGPNTPDEFPMFDGTMPEVRRSEIGEFDADDAISVLDGDVGPAESGRIARLVARGQWRGSKPHGGHRAGTGWGKTEFPAGWSVSEVVDWVNALIDTPMEVREHESGRGFILTGTYRGVRGEAVVTPINRAVSFIATAYPTRYDREYGTGRAR